MHAMKRFRLSRDLRGRSSSTASEDLPSPSKPPSKGLRTRSISDVFDHFHRDSSPSREGIPTVCYMGFAQIDDPKNAKEIQGIIKTVKETTMAQKPVKFTYKDGLLSVLEMSSERLLVCQLFHIAQCVHGFSDCFAVAFSGGHYGKQCHVFQAKSSREVSVCVCVCVCVCACACVRVCVCLCTCAQQSVDMQLICKWRIHHPHKAFMITCHPLLSLICHAQFRYMNDWHGYSCLAIIWDMI